MAGTDEVAHVAVGHVLDVGAPAQQLLDAVLAQVDARDLEAGAGELDGERQSDIAQADDADMGLVVPNAAGKRVGG